MSRPNPLHVDLSTLSAEEQAIVLQHLQNLMAEVVAQDTGHQDEATELDIELTTGAAVIGGRFDKSKVKSGKKYQKRY